MSIFNFLTKEKKQPTVVLDTTEVIDRVEVKVLSKPRTASEQLIFEIHQEFDTAEDRLLRQAEGIISSTKTTPKQPIEDKAIRLKAFGFNKAKTVIKAAEIIQERNIAEKILVKTESEAKLIKYYKRTYPYLKFLTETELDRICSKYSLIHAPVSAYSDDVPEKNIKEIEDAQKLNSSDELKPYYTLVIEKYWTSCPKDIQDILNEAIKKDIRVSFDSPSESDIMSLVRELGYNGSYTRFIYDKCSVKTIDKRGLFICAPSSHFDLNDLSEETKFGYHKVTINTDIKDPIVFRYVKGGVQVLSKWGLEAEDELLIEPDKN